MFISHISDFFHTVLSLCLTVLIFLLRIPSLYLSVASWYLAIMNSSQNCKKKSQNCEIATTLFSVVEISFCAHLTDPFVCSPCTDHLCCDCSVTYWFILTAALWAAHDRDLHLLKSLRSRQWFCQTQTRRVRNTTALMEDSKHPQSSSCDHNRWRDFLLLLNFFSMKMGTLCMVRK